MLKMRERESNTMSDDKTAARNERKSPGNKSLHFAANEKMFPVTHKRNITPNGPYKGADEKNKTTHGQNSDTKLVKKYLLKRIAESAYSFVET